VVQDYISGLKCLLYMQARDDLKQWEGQTPPRELKSKKAGEFLFDDSVPKSRFGPYMSARLLARQQMVAGGNTTDRSPVPPHAAAPAADAHQGARRRVADRQGDRPHRSVLRHDAQGAGRRA
jgi:hypothetical protein